MQQADRLSKIFFFLFCLSIPIQLNKFFWTDYSYVQGIRVDYITPALYLSDVFAGLFVIYSIFLNKDKLRNFLSSGILLPAFLFCILVSTLFAESLSVASYWSLKIVEMIFVAWAIKSLYFTKKNVTLFVSALLLGAFAQSFIAIGQFYTQSSLGGPFYFLGERTFNVETVGVATFFSAGKEYLRSYGTFPHPNVLALYLSSVSILFIYLILKGYIKNFMYSLLMTPILLALLLTFSRVIIISFFVSVIFLIVKAKKAFFYSALATVIALPAYIMLFSGRFLTLNELVGAFNIRIEFIIEGINSFLKNPFFGLGPNNTFLVTNNLPLFARFQPVHNVYLHVLFQVGLLGFLPVFVFLLKVISRIRFSLKNKDFWLFPIGISAVQMLLTAGFDHYHVTLQQGMIMVALILGLLFNRSMERELD